MADGRKLMKVKDVATMFGVTPYTIREWLKDPKVSLNGMKLTGGQWRIRENEAHRFAQEGYGKND